jgi:hypothetical protein
MKNFRKVSGLAFCTFCKLGQRFQARTALLAGTRFFSLRENGVYPYADFES